MRRSAGTVTKGEPSAITTQAQAHHGGHRQPRPRRLGVRRRRRRRHERHRGDGRRRPRRRPPTPRPPTPPARATTAADEDAATTTPSSGTASESTATDGGGDSADAEAALADLVAAAQEEGSVTIYSSQGLDQLNALGAAFEEEYGISVEVVRSADADMIARVDTELSTGTAGADLVVTAAQGWIEGHAAAGDCVDPTASPQIAGLGDYDADAVRPRGQHLRGRGGHAHVRLEHRARARRTHRLPGSARSVAGRRQDRRPRPGDRPGPRRLLPLARGVLRRGVRAAARGAGTAHLPQLAAARRGVAVRRDLRRSLRGAGAAGAGRRRAAHRSTSGSPRMPVPGARATSGRSRSPPTARTRRPCWPTSWSTAEGQELVQGASGSVLAGYPGHVDHQRPGAGAWTSRRSAPEPAAAYVEEWNAHVPLSARSSVTRRPRRHRVRTGRQHRRGGDPSARRGRGGWHVPLDTLRLSVIIMMNYGAEARIAAA